MTQILISTLNARYHHASFALRYLYANLGEHQANAKILEFTISQSPRDIVEAILKERPRVVGLGVYIWNTAETFEVVSILKKVSPETLVVLGGPEVSHETETQPICQLADHVIRGEADFLFRDFCSAVLGDASRPMPKWVSGELPEIRSIASPYAFYTDEDIRNRVLYVEASRGCPYKCEYCLSSLDKSVRSFDLDRFLADMERLIERGARQFKFVDRTFNLSISTSTRILEFFLARIDLGLFLHFEMVPDRLPVELRELIKKFPPGALQFEVGIQTWSPEVARLVSRRQDYAKIRENFAFLTRETGVHLHADLIAGLPGETLESFAEGFDAVYALGSHEIQVGILKRLKGTPIIRHDAEWKMVYQEHPPFQILSTRTMPFDRLQKMNRFAHFWDLIANSGNFRKTMEALHQRSKLREDGSFFHFFDEMADFLSRRHPQGHGVALLNLLESVWVYLVEQLGWEREATRSMLIDDYTGKVKRDVPRFLKSESAPRREAARDAQGQPALPRRQQKHWAPATS